jgi:hypothetical protein
MSRESDILKLGALGEALVKDTFEWLGLQVYMSEDRYDTVKDMIVDNESIEVKTLTPIKKSNSFCMQQSQWNKLDNVDRLFFIEVPDYGNPIIIYEAVKKYYFTDSFNDGIIKRFYPKQNMRIFRILRDEELEKQFRNYSDSTYLKRGPND